MTMTKTHTTLTVCTVLFMAATLIIIGCATTPGPGTGPGPNIEARRQACLVMAGYIVGIEIAGTRDSGMTGLQRALTALRSAEEQTRLTYPDVYAASGPNSTLPEIVAQAIADGADRDLPPVVQVALRLLVDAANRVAGVNLKVLELEKM